MPTYQYRCTSCGEPLEVVQKFTDAPLTVCPLCEGALRKVFSAVGVVFKGSGFYKTDSRPAAKPAAAAASAAKDGKAGGDAAPADKPAAATDATPAVASPATSRTPNKDAVHKVA